MVKDKTLPCGGNSLSDIYFLLNASVSLFDWRKDKFPSPLSQGLLYSIEPLAEGSEGLIIQTATANQSPSAKPDPLLPGHSSLQVCPQGNEFEGTLFFFPQLHNPKWRSQRVNAAWQRSAQFGGGRRKGSIVATDSSSLRPKRHLRNVKWWRCSEKKAREPCLNPRALSLTKAQPLEWLIVCSMAGCLKEQQMTHAQLLSPPLLKVAGQRQVHSQCPPLETNLFSLLVLCLSSTPAAHAENCKWD